MQFNLVVCGLDSIEARRWMNATLVNLVDPENPESLKPLIDGGTEGVNVQSYFKYIENNARIQVSRVRRGLSSLQLLLATSAPLTC